MKRIFLISFIACLFLLSSCSTLQSNWGMGLEEPHQLGHIYSGATHNIGSWCIVTEEKLNVGMKAFNFVVNAIDSPISFVADTLFLPVDLIFTPEHDRLTTEQICEAHRNRVK